MLQTYHRTTRHRIISYSLFFFSLFCSSRPLLPYYLYLISKKKQKKKTVTDARYEKDLRDLIKRCTAVRDEAARVPRGSNGVFGGFWDDKVLHIKKTYAKIQEIQDETSENKADGNRTVDDIMLDQMKHKYLKECQELLMQMAKEQQKAKKKVRIHKCII